VLSLNNEPKIYRFYPVETAEIFPVFLINERPFKAGFRNSA